MLEFVALFMLGAALGSFSLVLAWRMHAKRDWVKDRSACDSCGHILNFLDLIPVYSWLAQKGKCRYCHKKLPKELLLAELQMGFWVSMSYVFWPFELSLEANLSLVAYIAWVFALILFSALFWYDMRWCILPSKLIYWLYPSATIFVLVNAANDNNLAAVAMAALTAGLLSGFFWLLYTLSKGKWIGYGDVRLAVPLGLFLLTPLFAWLMVFIASVIGLLFASPSLLSKKKKLNSKIPFGPMLILATIITVLFGNSIVDLYSVLFSL